MEDGQWASDLHNLAGQAPPNSEFPSIRPCSSQTEWGLLSYFSIGFL